MKGTQMTHTRCDITARGAAIYCLLLLLLMSGCGGGCNKDRDEDEDEKGTPAVSGQANDTDREESGSQRGIVFNFDADSVGQTPKGWSHDRTGQGQIGNWIVVTDSAALSKPKVLA